LSESQSAQSAHISQSGSCAGAGATKPAATAQASAAATEGAQPEGPCSPLGPPTCLVRNLDTGEQLDLLQEPGQTFFGCGKEPCLLTGSVSRPWDGWWQERRRDQTEFWKAATTGNTERLHTLIVGAGASTSATGTVLGVDTRFLHGRTALHIAASRGHVACMDVLLGLRAEIEARTDSGFTALHLACHHGHLEVVCALHAAGCEYGCQTDQGELPLHLAATKGHKDVVNFLLEHSDPDLLNVKNSCGQRPLEVCLDIDTVQLFHGSVGCSLGGSLYSSCGCSGLGEGDDRYAGRTPYMGSVLLRNSRADAVRRLLHSADAAAGAAVSSMSCSPRRRHSSVCSIIQGDDGGNTRRYRKSFSKLHSTDNPDAVEVVGPQSFVMHAVLGRGSFGEVYRVSHKQTSMVYAMKVLKKNKIFGRNLVRYTLTERNLLSYVRHPFIVRLHYAFQTPTCLVMVLQYCPGGTLSELISNEGCLPEPLAKLYLAEVFLAIEHLHERNVVYRDLKPENIVLDDQGHALLTDFGLSKEGVEGFKGTRSFCGSVAYLAPEILKKEGHGPPVDLYGLGVLLYEALAGQPPYYSRDREALFRNIVTATLQTPTSASPMAAHLISSLMERDPAVRLGARRTSEVRHHPFFSGLDFARVLRREVPLPPLRHASWPEGGMSAPTSAGRVSSPFEGRLEAQVRRMSSPRRDLEGWEFATPASPGACSPAPSLGGSCAASPSSASRAQRPQEAACPTAAATTPKRTRLWCVVRKRNRS